jgi:Domain of unknown function (DUF4062)
VDKRYQVFISSTYADLKDERQRVIQALMEMDCIPAGMELFPAADDDQWKFIQRVIDDCDYYILIIGGRYGSISESGISYTEMEFDYAIRIGLNVLAFIHENPGGITSDKSELQPELREKLNSFRDRVKTGRLVKFWRSADQLPGMVALSLLKTIKVYPSIAWVRGNTVNNPELLNDLNEIRKENERLQGELTQYKSQLAPDDLNLASLDDKFKLKLTYRLDAHNSMRSDLVTTNITCTWLEIFAAIGPSLVEHPANGRVNTILAKSLYYKHNKTVEIPRHISIFESDFETIRVQLETHGLITLKYTQSVSGGMGLFWYATERGKKEIAKLRTIQSPL